MGRNESRDRGSVCMEMTTREDMPHRMICCVSVCCGKGSNLPSLPRSRVGEARWVTGMDRRDSTGIQDHAG